MSSIKFEYGSLAVENIVSLYKDDKLNLEPSFLRDSVWSLPDRKNPIGTLLNGYPIPSVFLYKRPNKEGQLIYDVMDGKQRIEAILMFQGLFRGKRYSVKTRLEKEADIEDWDWNKVKRKGHEHVIYGYKIQVVEVTGEFSEVVDLFVKLNSTGKRLDGAEKRNARYWKSEFLKEAASLANKYKDFFIQNKILSRVQTERMKHIELVCELMASINNQGPINKKKALDKVIGGDTLKGNLLIKCKNDFNRILNLVSKVFPEIKTTRFANSVDFYSIFFLIWELDKQQCVLNDRRRNAQAQNLLVWLSQGVDEVRLRVRKAEGATPEQRLFADYLFTVQGDTDSQSTRKKRGDILRGILGGIFEKKDERRIFTPEQRRLIWHSDEKKRCAICRDLLSWNNFTVDHTKPHTKGGRTSISNAALMCRSCNSRKGAR